MSVTTRIEGVTRLKPDVVHLPIHAHELDLVHQPRPRSKEDLVHVCLGASGRDLVQASWLELALDQVQSA